MEGRHIKQIQQEIKTQTNRIDRQIERERENKDISHLTLPSTGNSRSLPNPT